MKNYLNMAIPIKFVIVVILMLKMTPGSENLELELWSAIDFHNVFIA